MSILAAIQMTSTDNVEINLKKVSQLLRLAAEKGAQLVVLPENFALMSRRPEELLKEKEAFGKGRIQDFLANESLRHHMWIVGGTIPIAAENEEKIYAASLIFDDGGRCVARYDKMHLFDVVLPQEKHQESKIIAHGKTPVLIDTPLGKVGLAVCYDIRFPELFRYLFKRGAEIFVLPAAFTVPTGQGHWEVLARARAIENLSYFIAAAQSGHHKNGRATYGHSLIIDPWGKILASLSEGEGVIVADIDLSYLRKMRQKMPIERHQKPQFYC